MQLVGQAWVSGGTRAACRSILCPRALIPIDSLILTGHWSRALLLPRFDRPERPALNLKIWKWAKNSCYTSPEGSKFKLKRSGFGMFQIRIEYSRPPESPSPRFQNLDLRAGGRVRLDVETWCPPASQPVSADLQRLESRPGEPLQNRWVVLVPAQLHNLHACKYNFSLECQCYTLESIQNIAWVACIVLWTPNLNLSAWAHHAWQVLEVLFPDKKSCYILSEFSMTSLWCTCLAFIFATIQCHWPCKDHSCILLHENYHGMLI